ncbi:MAG: right-handed parallel beta-helix repeat-containing protein [Bacteroidetes bacterium]|nr:right-handed parallel beta-helix repeat-containing protein [Bacteroidota bacterium]
MSKFDAAQTTVVTSTYHNIGIEITFSSAPAAGTTANLFIKKSTDPSYTQAHSLTRIANNKFAGSAVQLIENTAYNIKISSNNFADILVNTTTKSNLYNQPNTKIFYVDSLGNDNNTGLSIGQAFQTIGKALSNISSAGTTIYVRKGTYYEGDLNITKSGTTGSPVTIRNFPGHKPILNGTDKAFNPTWVIHDVVNNVYKTSSSSQPLHAYINGVHMFHYLNLSDLVNKVWGQPNGFFHDGTTFYVRFPAGTTPANNKITVPKFTSGIQIDQQSNIVIKGFEICYFGYGPYPQGIYLNIASNVIIDSCSFHHTHLGVGIKRNSDFNTVQHCSFNESPKDEFNWDAVKTGGVAYEAGGIGIYTSTLPNKGNVFRYNTFKDMFDAMSPGSEDLAGYSSNLDIYDNVFDEIGDDGISLDGVAINLRVYNNIISNYLTGISAAPLSIGPSYIFRNLLYNSNTSSWKTNSIYTAYPFKFNVNSSLSTNWVYLYHNTSFSDIPACDGFLFKNYSDWHDIISRNNIYAGASYAFDNWSTMNPIDFDYDNLYTSHATKLFYWNGNNYNSLATFSSAINQEINGIVANPNFVSIPGADFHLLPSSAIIDKGCIINGFNNNYNGLKPDIGKYESGIITSLNDQGKYLSDLSIYPNPSINFVTIYSGKENLGSSFFICDILGKKLMNGKLITETSIVNLENLAPGIYFLQLEEGLYPPLRLIKQ